MYSVRLFIGMGIALGLTVVAQNGSAWAQQAQTPARQDTSAASAQVDQIIGEEREVVFEEAITAQPARPLIQFSHVRPAVNFSDVRVGPSARGFMTELRKGHGAQIESPVIDIWEMFPRIVQ